MRDLHNVIKATRCITPVAVGTTGTGKTGLIIDRQGYDALEYVIEYGSVTATNATITPVLKECDTTGGSFTSVADGDMLPISGAELNAALVAAATRTSGVSKNVVKKLGYVGNKRYTQLQLVNTVTAVPIVGATAILGEPSNAPVA